jgi:hypothetical protein
MADLESALLSARACLSGEISAAVGEEASSSTQESSTVAPEGNVIDGTDGFLFKPESDGEGKLVVLLPANLAYSVESLILKDEDGNEIERGEPSGYANGGREHFRFDKAGDEYPDNLTVEITLSDGTTKEYVIPDPSQRYD